MSSMSLAPAVATRTVTGVALLPDGTPARGDVEFVSTVTQLDKPDNVTIVEGVVRAPVNRDTGQWQATVPVTDDPDLTPGIKVYAVRLPGARSVRTITVPAGSGPLRYVDALDSVVVPADMIGVALTGLTIGRVTTLAPGSLGTAELRGGPPEPELWLGIPQGPQGDRPTIQVGTVTTGAAGSAVQIGWRGVGSVASPYLLDITIPRGATGAQGPQPIVQAGQVTKVAPGGTPTASMTGAGTAASPYTLALGLVTGDKGDKGDKGDAGPPGSSGVNVTDIGYDVIVTVGQSNGSGGGDLPRDPVLDPEDPRVYEWPLSGPYVGQIIAGLDPLNFPPPDASGGVAPHLEMARQYARALPVNRRVLVVPCNVGGSGLVGSSWQVGGAYLNRAITETNKAIEAAGPTARVAAIVWQQGEFDAAGNRTQAQYTAAMDAAIAELRSKITTATAATPVIIGAMVPEWRERNPGEVGTALQINAGQAATPGRVAATTYVDGPIGAMTGMLGIHYTNAGARELGRRFARTLISGPVAPRVTNVSAVQAGTSVTVTWQCGDAPPPTKYVVEYRTGTGAWTTGATVTTGRLWAVLTGLTNGTTYEVRVTATNSVGQGPPSASVLITPTSLLVPAVEFDARRLALADGASVASWASTAGSLTATQATVAARPTYRAGWMNTRPSVDFDGGDWLETAPIGLSTFATSGLFTAVAVFRLDRTDVDGGVFGLRDTDDNEPALIDFNWSKTNGKYTAEFFAGGYAGGYRSVQVYSGGDQYVVLTRSDTPTVWSNGVETVSTSLAAYTGTATMPLVLGAVGRGASDAVAKLDGQISYFGIWRGALTSAQRTTVTDALRAAFGRTE